MCLAWVGGIAVLAIQIASMRRVPWFLYVLLASACVIAALGAAGLFRTGGGPTGRDGDPPSA